MGRSGSLARRLTLLLGILGGASRNGALADL
jgi:hypothetical protein